ncbi:CIPK28 [Scenedesmus sp. PABB004]|nr:CIPK28 [Scenedesmus sp. PABB004]
MNCLLACLAKFCGHSLGMPPQYKFVRRVGKGTEGDVWLATDSTRGCLVAVKLVPRGPPGWRLAMVGREARSLARLGVGHVNIVRPYEVVLTTRHLAFVTEYVPGGSLSDYLERHSMDEPTARYFFRQLVNALGSLHARRMVYRDVKPANLLLTSTRPPFLKLCDFGLAHSWADKQAPLFATLAGTPGYMSPEIMSGFFAEGDAPPAGYDGVMADVYSAGVLLVVMLLHTMPWHYDAYAARLPPLEAMREQYRLEALQGVHWRDATSRAAKLSEPLAALLDTMLEPDVRKRASLQQVAASEWVNLPLPPNLQVGRREERRAEGRARLGAARSLRGDRAALRRAPRRAAASAACRAQAALDVLAEQQALREAGGGPAGARGVSEEEVARRLEVLDAVMADAATVDKGLRLERRLQLAAPPRGSLHISGMAAAVVAKQAEAVAAAAAEAAPAEPASEPAPPQAAAA